MVSADLCVENVSGRSSDLCESHGQVARFSVTCCLSGSGSTTERGWFKAPQDVLFDQDRNQKLPISYMAMYLEQILPNIYIHKSKGQSSKGKTSKRLIER